MNSYYSEINEAFSSTERNLINEIFNTNFPRDFYDRKYFDYNGISQIISKINLKKKRICRI